jgi:D-sedoheptulose 7-phosphate isomerase
MIEHMQSALAEASRLIAWLQEDQKSLDVVEKAAEELVGCFQSGGRILTCGNGGSMCDAAHFAQELSGRYRKDRPPLPAMAASDAAHLTCVANDFGFDQVFARVVEAWGRPGDILLPFSTSGNSLNLIAAAQIARRKKMKVVGLLGRDGGALLPLCDLSIVVPGSTSDRIQEIHVKIVHIIVELVERRMFSENYL